MSDRRHPSTRAVSLSALALLVLWGASFGASYVDLGAWTRVLALVIAAAKAGIVILVFMEGAFERSSIRATLVAAIAMIVVLVFFMVADVRTRAAPPLLPPVLAGK